METTARYRRLVEGLYGLRRFGVRLGLDNIRELCRRAGEPQRAFRSVHIAGTNGKGSVAAMVEAILRSAGHRVGLFTSPHLVSFTERIQVDRKPLSEREVLDLYDALRPHLDEMAAAGPGGQATFFEVTMILACLAFREARVEWAVMETGLGGRLDATNVIEPELCLITRIDFDHTEYLGETIESIAREKAGIMKRGVPAIAARQRPEVESVLETAAREIGAPLTFADPAELELMDSDLGGQVFRRHGKQWRLRLIGEHQLANAALALSASDVLGSKGLSTDAVVMKRALAEVDWPGRFEVVATDPLVVLDGAHNPGGVSALVRCFQKHSGGSPCNLIFSALSDKAVDEMVSLLAPLAKSVAVVPVASSRSIRPDEVLKLFRAANPRCESRTFDDFEAGWKARSVADPTLVTGSLFLVGEALNFFRGQKIGVRPGHGDKRRTRI